MVTQEAVLTHPLVIPNCVNFDIRWTFKSWEIRIYLWCLLLRNNVELVICEKNFHCCTWYSPLYWIGYSHVKENSGAFSQVDLLEIMSCIICTRCKFDPSLGCQSDVSLKSNITLGRVSRILSFVFKMLQFMRCVFYTSFCIWHCGKNFATDLSNSLKHFPWNFLFGGGKVKKYTSKILQSLGFMNICLHGRSCKVRMVVQGGPFLFLGFCGHGKPGRTIYQSLFWVYLSQW